MTRYGNHVASLHTALLCSAIAFFVPSADAQDDRLQGRASVVDADTIEIHGERVRLEGIDAPEARQPCSRGGVTWRCGQTAALALSDYLGAKPIDCFPRGRDRYGRVLARCFLAGVDIQAWLVGNGWAFAYARYSTDYVGEETAARTAGVGIWTEEPVQPPWEWRAAQR